MLKSHLPDIDQVIKMCRRTILSEKQLKERCDEEENVFIDGNSNKCWEVIKEKQRNAISPPSMFEIVPSFIKWKFFYIY